METWMLQISCFSLLLQFFRSDVIGVVCDFFASFLHSFDSLLHKRMQSELHVPEGIYTGKAIFITVCSLVVVWYRQTF